MSIFKETLDFYKNRRIEEREKKKLLSVRTDFHFLEKLIQKCNDNPALRITVYLRDGARLELATMREEVRRDYELFEDNLEIR